MEDVERLARLAYPDAAPGMLLAKDQFIDSLTEDEDTAEPSGDPAASTGGSNGAEVSSEHGQSEQRNWILRQQGCREGAGLLECTLMFWKSCSGA